ncbi:MAG: hypothetical protein ABEN55_11520, partial [Bradymonadaceae bacterium]
MQAIPFILVALGIGGFWWYRRRQSQKAQEPKCPVCRSRNLEGVIGEIGSGTAVLDDEFLCLDCGLDPTELDASTRDLVEALRDLQKVEYQMAEVSGKSVVLAVQNDSLILDLLEVPERQK